MAEQRVERKTVSGSTLNSAYCRGLSRCYQTNPWTSSGMLVMFVMNLWRWAWKIEYWDNNMESWFMQKANTLGFMLCQHLRGAFWSSATLPNCASSRSYQNTNNQCGWEWVNFNFHEFPIFVLCPGDRVFWEDSWTIENESCSLFKPCGKKHPRSQATHPRHPSLLHLVTAIVIETSAGHNCIQGPEPKQELPKPGTSSSYRSCGLKCCRKEWFEMRN